MPSIRITRFGGLLPQVNPKELASDRAQLAHNCLLWDGWLWPMPQWTVDGGSSYAPPAALYKDITQPNGYNSTYWFTNPIQNKIEPFNNGDLTGIMVRGGLGHYLAVQNSSNIYYLGTPAPQINSHSFNIYPQNQSVYPITRTYALTAVAGGREGPPTVFEQLGTNGTLFEGDVVSLFALMSSAQIVKYGITSVILYRSVPGFDTSEQLGNPLETGFHRVTSFAVSPQPGGADMFLTIGDEHESAAIAGDLLISDQWIPPTSDIPIFFGLTESGWFITVRNNGAYGYALQFSERFMNHAWPMQNTVLFPENVTGVAVYYDDIFIGTQSTAYRINVESGETETLNINVRPFKNEYACVNNSMVATNFGAMYAAKDGLIALTTNTEAVASKAITSPGDIVPIVTLSGSLLEAHLYDITKAGWWNGNYFGFLNDGSNGYAYMYNQPSPSNEEFELGQLVTIDAPGSNVVDLLATGAGFFGVWPNGIIYKLPLPGYGYEVAEKATYTWQSKRYVLAGLTTFAGMKVVNDNSGDLTITLNGYNNGGEAVPSFVFTRTLNHSKPFRLPHQHKCLEWDIKLVGTAVVQEIHVATSYEDLVETNNA